MMNPAKVPSGTIVADLLALAEAIGSPAGKRETLALIAEQLASVQATALEANTKYTEIDTASRKLAKTQSDLSAREATLEAKLAALADSHNGLSARQTQVSLGETELARAKEAFEKELRETRAELDTRERTAKEMTERAASLSSEAQAVKTEYKAKLAKLKALAGG